MKVLALIVLILVLTVWDVTGSPLEYEQENLQTTVAEDGDVTGSPLEYEQDNLQNTVAEDGAISRFPLAVESRYKKLCPSFFPWCP